MKDKRILEVKNLNISFRTYAGISRAVRGVDFHLNRGETLAIVGESGCGKTVTAKSILGLLPEPQSVVQREGSAINFENKNLLDLNDEQMADVRGKEIAMIFQDPMTSLNPTMKVGNQVAESLIVHEKISIDDAKKEAKRMLDLVRIPDAKERMNQYPFELSGGMRQRVMIAIALACKPKILIADEPTTALDVTIQAQIIDLIKDLQEEFETGVILVTHDLGVVAGIADRIQVMYAGKIVERGKTDDIFYDLKHPYSYALLKSVPKLHTESKETLYSLAGTPPDSLNPPKGCPFAARCEFSMKVCRLRYPQATSFGDMHESSCWLHHHKADRNQVPEILLKRGGMNGK